MHRFIDEYVAEPTRGQSPHSGENHLHGEESRVMNPQLTNYLREIESRLRFLPDADREAEIAEITSHLGEAVAQKIAQGQTEDAATEAAITQFGAARDVGSRLYQTGKHKRFAGLWETALFCVAFSALLSLVWQVSLRIEHFFAPSFGNGPFAQAHTVPVGWALGFPSLLFLLFRYRGHGVAKKAFGPSPTGAAMHWLFLVFLLNVPTPAFLLRTASGLFGVSLPLSQIAITGSIVFSYTLWLATAGGAAYWLGRRSKTQESVSDAISVAVAAGAAVTLLQMACQFMPVLSWQPYSAPFLENVSGYTRGFSLMAAYGIVRFFVARTAVRLGEARRNASRPVS